MLIYQNPFPKSKKNTRMGYYKHQRMIQSSMLIISPSTIIDTNCDRKYDLILENINNINKFDKNEILNCKIKYTINLSQLLSYN